MASNIMFQGTSSSVGKTILTAGFCRIFKQDGFKVAPFKSQNMTSKSFFIEDGKEVAGSQVIQAEAAGIDPKVEMNPILLKPVSNSKSQVIVNGTLNKEMSSADYQSKKGELKNIVKSAYDVLDNRFDVVVIEGAGSPAEINLNKNDIVNMGVANLVDSPVILIGDIDRGGIFASIYGTVMLLNEEERNRIKGFIVNKFRGDVEILKPGIKMLEDLVNKPCLGIIPYFEINIEDEDSLVDPEAAPRRKEIREKSNEDEYKKIKELEYEKLANVIRENVDLNYIKRIMGI